jgi:site-specific DNA-methyltransferase (adenine-specific)
VKPVSSGAHKDKAIAFLKDLTTGNRIFLKYDNLKFDDSKNLLAYVYLVNKTFLNAKLISNGFAQCDESVDFQYKDRFLKYEEEAKVNGLGIWAGKGLVHA